jgi:phosphatidylglycerophosphatase A
MASPVTDRAAFVLATWFGCGLSKIAPGTVGSLGAIPLHLLLAATPLHVHLLCIVLMSAGGIWAAGVVAGRLGAKDPQMVVIDEVAGTLIALGAVRDFGVVALTLAFVLFRALDITKPGLIRRAENLSPVGLGVMADDLIAGVAAGVLARGACVLLPGFG